MRTTEIGKCTPDTGPMTPGMRRPVRTITLPSTSSRRMIFSGSARGGQLIRRATRRAGGVRLPRRRRFGPVELERVGLRLERGDDEGDVLVEVDPEVLAARAELLAVDGGGERRLLHLLLH